MAVNPWLLLFAAAVVIGYGVGRITQHQVTPLPGQTAMPLQSLGPDTAAPALLDRLRHP